MLFRSEREDVRVDICAKIVVDREKLPPEAGTDNASLDNYFSAQIKTLNQQMPAYKAIKYFLMTDKDLIKTTTLKVKRPLEQDAIKEWLTQNNLVMKTASGRFIG